MSRFNNTIIEQPPSRRSMSTTGVINLIDDDSNSPPAIRRRITEPAHDEDIIILDDDHGRRAVNGTANRPIVISDNNVDAGPWNRRRSFRIFSPPPPPPMFHPIPPVPQIPPPVIANPQPFAILAPPQAPEDIYRRRAPFDEPPQPSTSTASTSANRGSGIQLGGGLVSQGLRPRRGGQASRTNDTPAGAGVDGPPRAGRIVATFVNEPEPPAAAAVPHNRNNNDGPRQRPRISDILGVFSLEQVGRRATRFFGIDPIIMFDHDHRRHAFQRRDEAIGLGPDYTKDLTHPGAPPPGWSFNFGTEDVDVDNDMKTTESKPTAPSEVLVCAMCLDPLYANIDGRNDLSAEEKKRRRIWALRCGHMFDGKCMETFMAPTWTRERPSTTTMKEEEKPVKAEGGLMVDEATSSQDKGKGKEKMKDEVSELGLDTVDETAASQVSIPATPAPTLQPEPEVQLLDSVSSEATSSQPTTATTATVGSTSTTTTGARYNLRTRPSRQEATSTTNTNSSRSTRRGRAQDTETSTSPRRTTTRGTKRKFGEDKKVISEEELRKNEARYNWSCRVAGCGRMHSSYNWQGEWKPDEENGPIAVYI